MDLNSHLHKLLLLLASLRQPESWYAAEAYASPQSCHQRNAVVVS